MFISKLMYALGVLAVSYLCYRLSILIIGKDGDRDLHGLMKIVYIILFDVGLPGGLLLGWLDHLIDENK